jgi:hypothetical protein
MLSKGNEAKEPRPACFPGFLLTLRQVVRFEAVSISFRIISSGICTA